MSKNAFIIDTPKTEEKEDKHFIGRDLSSQECIDCRYYYICVKHTQLKGLTRYTGIDCPNFVSITRELGGG
jgi:hypothetical protein